MNASLTAQLSVGEGGKLTWDNVDVELGFDASGNKVVAASTPLGWLSTFIESANVTLDETTGKPVSIKIGFGPQTTATASTTSPVTTPLIPRASS